jgi:uncharacterized protein YbaR (Trm112 family)
VGLRPGAPGLVPPYIRLHSIRYNAGMSGVPAIQPWFLELARCPATGARLALADDALLARVNAAISAGMLVDASDEKVTLPLEAGLVDAAATRLYPVRDGIPSLVAGEAIPLSQSQLIPEAS